jgi:perosamine synthetase
MIPRYDLTFQYGDLTRALRASARADIDEILCAQLKKLYAVKHVFTFDSARIALVALLKAYNHPGEVLMPAYTCIVVPEAVQFAGYQPIFADIDCQSLNVTRDTLIKSLTTNTTVVLATHLFGIPCDIDEVLKFGRENNLLVVEDAAPAIGAEFQKKYVSSFGDASIISFQATKVISGEDGGALLTNNDMLAEKVSRLLETANSPNPNWYIFVKAMIRKIALSHLIYPLVQFGYRLLGKEVMYEVVSPETERPECFLKRCSPFSSALVLVQLDRLSRNLERRRQLAQIYIAELSNHPDIALPRIAEHGSPSWIQFPILVRDKQGFYQYMQKHGIDMSWTYRYSCADSYGKDGFPESNKAARTVMGLPTYPSLTDSDARYICEIAKKYSPASK